MATPTIKSTFFHPEHLLAKYRYSDASTYPCAACERVVTGMGYSCDKCNFNIHEACFSLPHTVNSTRHPGHVLTFTRLGASRWCNVCKETSHAGRYMYICSPCNFDMHPRCTSLADAHLPQAQGVRHGRGTSTARTIIKVGIFGFRVVDLLTGGLLSPVLDTIDAAVDN